MNAQHTPGPWEAVGNLVRSPMDQPAERPRGVQIADCRDGYFLPHSEEAKANASLIAAAPDLLKACQMLLTLIRKNAPELSGKVCGYADDAIAKATVAKS